MLINGLICRKFDNFAAMKKVWLFYPENDIALGSGLKRFTAPKNAARLREECAFMMASVADDGDAVIYSSRDERFERRLLESLGKHLSTEVADAEELCPWGWSAASRQILIDLGVDRCLLPDDKAIEQMKELSHRRTSIEINRRLMAAGFHVPQLPKEITSVDDIDLSCRWMLKTPWSSSGRGVFDTRGVEAKRLADRIAGVVRKQGSVVAEPFLAEIRSFAMLYEMEGGVARYLGLSLFENHPGGAYAGNVVASQEMLERELSRYVEIGYQRRLSLELGKVLEEVIGESYSGYCGVDMMVYDDGGAMKVAPCVELNLRMTMGIMAYMLADKVLAPGRKAMFAMGQPDDLCGAVFENNRLVSGDVALTPPGGMFAFVLRSL